jgi:hypothetical protein
MTVKRCQLKIAALTASAVACLYQSVAFGHHSFAMFDTTRQVTVEGTVKQFDWTNPHTWIWVEVSNAAGGVDTWAAEGVSPNSLLRSGWTRDSLKPGDKIVLVLNPLKDGRKGGSFVRATLADGRALTMFKVPLGARPLPPP